MKIYFKCSEGNPFQGVQEKLQAISGITAVAKLAGEKGGEEGMVEVDNQETGEAAVKAMEALGASFLSHPSASEDARASKSRRADKKDKKSNETEFFDSNVSLKDQRQRKVQENLDEHNKAQAHAAGGAGKNQQRARKGKSEDDANSRNQSGGRGGRGGRGGGRGGYKQNYSSRGSGGGGRRGYVMPQFIEGHVASINNVPMSMTNDQIATVFEDCGVIYDIARYETLAMVYFDCQDSVLNAIVHVNGSKKMNGNVTTVSDGGTLRVPIPNHLNPQAMSPQYLHLHQQGMMAPLSNPMHLTGAPQEHQDSDAVSSGVNEVAAQ